MAKTHWKKLNNPDFLGAYAVDPGEDLIATIKSAAKETFTGTGGKKDEGIVIRFQESDIKPMICNTTNAKAITKVVGSPYIEDWSGHKIALYVAEVSAFGETVDALRVRPYAPKVEEITCSVCGGPVKAAYGKSPKQMAKYTEDKFGKVMCADCAKKEAENGTDES